MQTAKCSHQLEEHNWNNFPGSEPIIKTLFKLGAEVVDTGEPYWVNKNDTLVFQLNLPEHAKNAVELIASLLSEVVLWRPDEIDHQILEGVRGNIIFRLWWD